MFFPVPTSSHTRTILCTPSNIHHHIFNAQHHHMPLFHSPSWHLFGRPPPPTPARLHASASSDNHRQHENDHQFYTEDGSSIHDLLALYLQKKKEAAAVGNDVMQKPINHSSAHDGGGSGSNGSVYLVGTGPGDPELLTVKAVRLMQTADVVLYDRLVSQHILQLVNPSALMVYVGKQRSYHTRTQQEIHELLRTFAADGGATVIRLKGGDPFIFGRGGEEAQYLQERGVSVHCVPGITAAAGISAQLGIPLTHRGLATSVRILTGHAREGGEAALDEAIATAVDPHTTLIVYMGLATLRRMVGELMHGGLRGDTPAAAIERGTTPEQRIVWSRLDGLADETERAALKSPTLIVIGKVVAVAQGWQRAQARGVCLEIPSLEIEEKEEEWSWDYNPIRSSGTADAEIGSGWRML